MWSYSRSFQLKISHHLLTHLYLSNNSLQSGSITCYNIQRKRSIFSNFFRPNQLHLSKTLKPTENHLSWTKKNIHSTEPNQQRIQDFPEGGVNSQSGCANLFIFAENCMKMKEFLPQDGGRPWRPPQIRHCKFNTDTLFMSKMSILSFTLYNPE